MMATVETDYLIVGAGAVGMAFADALVADSDADVVLVDRRDRPGGHWNDAYPFVRLHMPSASYGVNSRPLGDDRIVESGRDAGFYERASAAEVCDYYQRVLDETLVASGRLRFHGMCDYHAGGSGEHQVVSRVTGATTTVRVRRKLVDATYLTPTIPATSPPSFGLDPHVRLIPPNDLVHLHEPGSGYTVLGSGKTGMDTCQWLLDHDVPPERIRWIRPRDTWLLNRPNYQPLTGVPRFIESQSRQIEAAALAEDVVELFARLEATDQLLRLDPDVEPTMLHGASVGPAELADLRRIEHVVRAGRVVHLGTDQIVLERATIPTDRDQIHIDATARGAPRVPARPIFEPDRITVQNLRMLSPVFSAAAVGFVEATWGEDATKNRLCPPNPYPDAAVDWIATAAATYRLQVAWADEPDLKAWLRRSRLNRGRGVGDHLDDPRVQASLSRLIEHLPTAISNLDRLQSHLDASAERPRSARPTATPQPA